MMPIRSFACRDTQSLFESDASSRFRSIEQVARRKLLQLHAAVSLDDLRVPPGNHLEALKGDRSTQCSIRVNIRWRLCFVWERGNADEVQIVDYH